MFSNLNQMKARKNQHPYQPYHASFFFGVASSFLQISHEYHPLTGWRLAKLGGVEGLRHGDPDDISVDGSRWLREWLAMYLFLVLFLRCYHFFVNGVLICLCFLVFCLCFLDFFGFEEKIENKCDANQVIFTSDYIRNVVAGRAFGSWCYWGTIFTWNTNPQHAAQHRFWVKNCLDVLYISTCWSTQAGYPQGNSHIPAW